VAAPGPADRQRLGRLVQRFLRYVSIEGCGGLGKSWIAAR